MNIVFKQLILIGSLLAIGVQPVFAQELERGNDGTLACGGNHNIRRGGTEIGFTSYNFRNFNADNAITIESITIFAADGTVLRNMPSPLTALFRIQDQRARGLIRCVSLK